MEIIKEKKRKNPKKIKHSTSNKLMYYVSNIQ